MNWEEFLKWLEYPLPFASKITVADLLVIMLGILLTYFVARFLIWLVNQKILDRFFRKKQVDTGRRYALRQMVSYLIWALAVFTILEILGISNIIIASSAALLVGIGLGLQDTFKDLICGIVILTEGTVEIGNIIEVGGQVAMVSNIGLRVSKVETRDKITILIPNSKLVVEQVVNWSHERTPTRFIVQVGVAYGSDLEIVKSLLLKAAAEHEKVLAEPAPFVQFKSFGDSSLDFDLFFFSYDFFRIDFVKSDIRFAIDRLFRENGVEIPFPQRDLWIKNPGELK